MALTITSVTGRKESMGSKRFEIVELAFDSSYPTGGEALTPATLGFQTIDFVLVEPAGGYTFEYDHTNQKVIARVGDNDAGADGPGAQVASEANLATVTAVRCLVIGTV